MKRVVSGIMLILLLIGILTLASNIRPVKAEPRTWIVDDDGPADFHTIQEAIYAASDEDTIFVKNGVYYENPVVNKTILLIGEDCEKTVVDGRQMGDVFLVASNNVIITNFKVMNSSIGHNGICLLEAQKCTVSNCNVTRNHVGIFLYYSSNNTLSSNNITDSWDGLQLYNSANNSLSENKLRNNMDCGIGIQSSPNNTLKNNILTNNLGSGILIFASSNSILRNNSISGGFSNFGVWDPDELLPNFVQDVDTSNIVDDKPIYYWINEKNKKVPSDAGCVSVINSSNVTAANLNLTNNYHGILFFHTTNSSILNNNITANSYGIKLCYSSNNTISENKVVSNGYGVRLDSSSDNNRLYKNTIVNNKELYGILIDSSLNNIVCLNTITNDKSGILIWYYSYYNSLYENSISNNTLYGIVVRLYSNSNVLSGNNVTNNWYGIRIEDTSSNNIIYHNNFINNTKAFDISMSVINIWDDGHPSGGNYWSDYIGTDADADGIGDTEYAIDGNNTDHYPLMGMFSSFNTSTGFEVNVVSNSTVKDFQYFESNNTIRMHVCNMTANQTFGFVRICIPHTLMNDPYQVTIDGGEPYYVNYTLYDNGTHRWIYFSYQHSTLEVIIIPEFPSFLILPIFMIATLLAVIFYEKEIEAQHNH